jgi:hypothetical protein
MPIFMDTILLNVGARGGGGQASTPSHTLLGKNQSIRKKEIYQTLRPNITGIKNFVFSLEYSMVIEKYDRLCDLVVRVPGY